MDKPRTIWLVYVGDHIIVACVNSDHADQMARCVSDDSVYGRPAKEDRNNPRWLRERWVRIETLEMMFSPLCHVNYMVPKSPSFRLGNPVEFSQPQLYSTIVTDTLPYTLGEAGSNLRDRINV